MRRTKPCWTNCPVPPHNESERQSPDKLMQLLLFGKTIFNIILYSTYTAYPRFIGWEYYTDMKILKGNERSRNDIGPIEG